MKSPTPVMDLMTFLPKRKRDYYLDHSSGGVGMAHPASTSRVLTGLLTLGNIYLARPWENPSDRWAVTMVTGNFLKYFPVDGQGISDCQPVGPIADQHAGHDRINDRLGIGPTC